MPKIVTYNFMPQWAHLVESGHKPHTIRKRRTRRTLPGDTLRLYAGQRTKACRLLREATCEAVTDIEMDNERYPWPSIKLYADTLYYEAGWLNTEPLIRMAQWDGFQTVADFCEFFYTHYSPEVACCDLELIEWRTPERAGAARWQQAPPAGEKETT